MATTTWPAQGTTIGVDISGFGTYSLVNQITSFGHAGGGSVGMRDTTTLNSTVHTSAPTIPDNGEFTFSVLFDPTDAVHASLRTWQGTPTLGGVQITYNDTLPNTDTAHAWMKEFDGINGDDVDSSLAADITLQITGAWVHV